MKVSLNKTDNVNGIITIELKQADYQESVDKSLNQFRNKAEIPGFRKGKVPKGVIQKMYGKSVLADEINKIVGNELFKYIKENNLNILGEPLPNETEQKEIDFDKDVDFEFNFDIALAPELDLTFGEDDVVNYYVVKPEEEIIEQQIDSIRQNAGSFKTIEEGAIETDLLKGVITELENGEAKEEGIIVENGIIMPSYIKDEATKAKFVGAKAGDIITFNPKVTYDNHASEISSLLNVDKEEVEDINSDFTFEIKEVTRYEEAELNQELFDKVLGEGVVTSEEEFRNKIIESITSQIKPAADNLFISEAKKLILSKLANVEFPDAFLKKWLVVANENNTEEKIEDEYSQIVEDLKFHLAKEKIVKENDIKVENDEMQQFAIDAARAQFAQYGMNNLTNDMLANYAQSMLQDEDTSRNMYDKLIENKVGEWLKEKINLDKKEVTSEELKKILQENAGDHVEVEEVEDTEATSTEVQ